MAEWRARGYVPDSDEEDESQGCEKQVALGAEEGFEDLDDTNEGVGNLRQETAPGTGYKVLRGETEENNKEARENPTLHDQVAKNTHARTAAAEGHNDDVWSYEDDQRTVCGAGAPRCSEGIDELQQDHYHDMTATQSKTELSNDIHLHSEEPNRMTGSQALSDALSSLSSSPLSEPLQSPPRASPSVAQWTNPLHGQGYALNEQPSPPSGNHISSVVPGEQVTQNLAVFDVGEQNRGRRNLRHRNPIQLRPYAIESEKYRQILKARGVKPLRIARMEADLANAIHGDTSEQEFDAGEDSQLITHDADSQDLVASSPLIGRGARNSPTQDLSDVFLFEGDELPDMDLLLRQPLPHVVIQGIKRRKTAHTFSRKGQKRAGQTEFSLPKSLAASLSDNDSMFDVPPSPPRSESLTPTATGRPLKDTFRVPRGLSPVALLTPLTSSEPRKYPAVKPFNDLETTDDSGDESRNQKSDKDSELGSSLSESGGNSQLKSVQRKIKGVLPASWLKLDLKTNNKKPRKADRIYRSTSPVTFDQRGIARPVSGLRSRSPNAPIGERLPIVLSDTEDSDLGWSRPNKAACPDSNPLHSPGLGTRDVVGDQGFSAPLWAEVEEDNRIDPMLPLARRSNIHSRKSRTKGQTTLNNFVSERPLTAAQHLVEGSRIRPSHKPRTIDDFETNRKKNPKFRPPRLSIIDMAAQNQPFQESSPQFLKIASRTARVRNDQGRHSPSKKFLRLATADDTNDVNKILQNWREGTFASAPMPPLKGHAKALDRQPLYPRSHKVQLPQMQLRHHDTAKDSVHSSHKTRLARHASSSTKPRLLQRLLDNNVMQCSAVPYIQLSHERQRTNHSRVKLNLKKSGQLLSSLRTQNGSRPALLESLQGIDDRKHRGSAFKRNLNRIDRTQIQARGPTMLLAKFFNEEVRLSTKAKGLGSLETYKASRIGAEDGRKHAPHRMRKQRRPHHIDVGAINFKPPHVLSLVDNNQDHPLCITEEDPRQLIGLGPFGTRYTDDFDVKPLSRGTCFHESTFIGSGEFSESFMVTSSNDLDRSRGFASLIATRGVFRWGPWNDEVSGQLGQVFDTICWDLRIVSAPDQEVLRTVNCEQLILLLKKIINYFSKHLSFLDPIDRNSYLQRCKILVSRVLDELGDCVVAGGFNKPFTNYERSEEFRIHFGTLLLVIANQLREVSQHAVVPYALKDEVNSLVIIAARQNLSAALTNGFEACRLCLESLRRHKASGHTIRENHPVEALVINQHIIRATTGSMAAFWEIVNKQLLVRSPGKAVDARIFEDQWQKLYSVLPFLDFDAQGILEYHQHFHISCDNWAPIKRMISQVLDAYMSDAGIQSASFNAYCRALHSRCLYLISEWGWQRCELVIGTLFDFFARNNLAHLRNEESHGSPLFLEHLDQKPSLQASPNDRCFHILLKIIGSGLNCMRQIYPEKKIRDIIWRLMPNHGRFHPKEEAIRHEDLDALRNHHDLLCTLYWAAPPGFRPRLSVIRNLVDLESSHREACHINIRAWSNLVRFQLSTDESVSSLESFTDWHNDLLGQILRQHSLARTEAEEQVKSAQRFGSLVISQDLLESTIARNQRQVEAILSDALLSLKCAIGEARTREAAEALLSPTLNQVFLLFDSRRPQVDRNIIEALDVLLAYAGHYSKSLNSQIQVGDSKDDSQDYGDWSGFNDGDLPAVEDEVSSPPLQTAVWLQETFHEPLRHLLSNCFGADTAPDESLLLKLVEVWVAVARCSVRHGSKSWNDYVGRFGQDSWASLRDTEQARKFTTYFLAMLVETDSKVYNDNKSFFLISWITSLAERDSMLKFQHRLTSALLNTDPENLLLRNLPFYAKKSTDRFELTATEFSQRRLSLISSILSNMRESVDCALCTSPIDATKLKQDYKEILKRLMLTMKQRYQELGHGSDIRGAYVDFVHRVVEFLQQHTSAICPVDRFFMDSAAFPLPATDPTYVVGQLKNYGLRLQESRTPKQLAVFLQSVAERAVLDGQQEYLVSQLYAALASTFEYGDPRKLTLRAFIIKAIIPGYMEVAFSTTSGWLLALPVLEALERVFYELLTGLDGTSPASVAAVLSTIIDFFGCLHSSLDLLTHHSGLLDQPKVLKVLAICYSTIIATAPLLDYIARLVGPSHQVFAYINFFRSFATFVSGLLLDQSDVLSPETADLNHHPTDARYDDVRKFTLQELRETLNNNWTCHDEQYHNIRGNSRREVMVNVGSHTEEKQGLMVRFERFTECLSAMPALRSVNEEMPVKKLGEVSLDDILFC